MGSDVPELVEALPGIEIIDRWSVNVYGVVDASGAHEVTIRENAVARMKDHGITPINWTTVTAELQRNWTLPTGQDLGRVFHDHYQSLGLLMDSFESTTANAVKKAS